MLLVCDFRFGGNCGSYILYIGLFQCNGGFHKGVNSIRGDEL